MEVVTMARNAPPGRILKNDFPSLLMLIVDLDNPSRAFIASLNT
jgi:hypothetical protein